MEIRSSGHRISTNGRCRPSQSPIDGDWYAVACLDTYENRGVVIPVRTLLRQGQLAITDVTLP